ncbi:hypothetical protein B0F90DRAFT_1767293, partial [Multifurca ochricompacta]
SSTPPLHTCVVVVNMNMFAVFCYSTFMFFFVFFWSTHPPFLLLTPECTLSAAVTVVMIVVAIGYFGYLFVLF